MSASAREIRKTEFKKELADLLDIVIPKGAISICLIADADEICKVSRIASPEFTIKVADIQSRGFDMVFNEAWGLAVTEVESER